MPCLAYRRVDGARSGLGWGDGGGDPAGRAQAQRGGRVASSRRALGIYQLINTWPIHMVYSAAKYLQPALFNGMSYKLFGQCVGYIQLQLIGCVGVWDYGYVYGECTVICQNVADLFCDCR